MVKQIKSDDFQTQVERPRRQKTVRITQNSRVEMARDFQIFQRPGRQLRQKSIFFSDPKILASTFPAPSNPPEYFF